MTTIPYHLDFDNSETEIDNNNALPFMIYDLICIYSIDAVKSRQYFALQKIYCGMWNNFIKVS